MAYLHTAFNDQSNSHTQPIIHRDLKSANLLLATNPQLLPTGAEDVLVKISDFGLCRRKALKGRQWDPHTAQMTNCGSMLWTAPEILANESCEQQIHDFHPRSSSVFTFHMNVAAHNLIFVVVALDNEKVDVYAFAMCIVSWCPTSFIANQ